MRKLLTLILIALLLALSIFIVLQGFEVGSIEVLSFRNIQAKNNELDGKIQEASKLAEKDYKKVVSEVKDNAKKLEETKKKYEDQTVIAGDDIQVAAKIDEYEIQTLWVKIGTYATTEGVALRMNIVNSSSGTEGNYDLNFTANGSYISITDFISDIENDSTLGFKIEKFKIQPTTTTAELSADFTCKDIAIKYINGTTPTSTSSQSNTTNTTNTTNSTNTSNTNSTTNSTNSTNTSNTTNSSS